MNFQALATAAITGNVLSRTEALAVLQTPDTHILELLSATYQVRKTFCGQRVHLHLLINAKSGMCPEDCHYCSQSRLSSATIERYPLVSMHTLLAGAHKAKQARSRRYCIVISTRGANAREIDFLTRAVRRIKEEVDIAICCSLGLLTEEKAQALYDAGVEQLNHNLNTSEHYYPQICTTHTYQDRLATLQTARKVGLKLCSGALFGQGESAEDIIDVLLALRDLNPQSLPINFLLPIAGTPFAHHHSLRPYDCLRILCLARLLNPTQEIRVAAGREAHLRSLQPMALYAANSVFVSGYLTEPGQDYQETWQMLNDLGFEIEE